MHRFIIIVLSLSLALALLLIVFGSSFYHLDYNHLDSKLFFSRKIYYAPNFTSNNVTVQTISGRDYFVGSVGYSYSPYDVDVVGVLLWVYPKTIYHDINDFVNDRGVNGVYETYADLSIVPSGWNNTLPFNEYDMPLSDSDIHIFISENGVVNFVNRDNILSYNVGFDSSLRMVNQVFSLQNNNKPLQNVDNILDAVVGVFYNMPNWLYGYYSGLMYYVLGVKL